MHINLFQGQIDRGLIYWCNQSGETRLSQEEEEEEEEEEDEEEEEEKEKEEEEEKKTISKNNIFTPTILHIFKSVCSIFNY
jgi:hypothetical protein